MGVTSLSPYRHKHLRLWYNKPMSTMRPDHPDHPNYRDFEFPYQNTDFNTQHADSDCDDRDRPPRRARQLPARSQNDGPACCSGCLVGCFGLVVLIVIACAALWYALFSGSTRLVVSEATTIITGPLTADGTVDFHQAIKNEFEPDIPPEDNGFRAVLLTFGRTMFASDQDGDWQFQAMCRELGVDPAATQELEISQGLDAVRDAVNSQHYFIPLIRQSERDLVATAHPHAMRVFHSNLPDALRQRAGTRFAAGETEEAWKDFLASIRLFRFVPNNAVWQDGALATGRFLTPVDDVIATLPQWSPEQLRQAIGDLESLPPWRDRQATLRIMQFILLDALSSAHDFVELLERSGVSPEEIPEDMLGGLMFIAFDWNIIAREMNREIREYSERLTRAEGRRIEEQFAMLGLRREDERHNFPETDEQRAHFLAEELMRTSQNPLTLFTGSGWSQITGSILGYFVRLTVGDVFGLQLMEDSRTESLRLALALELFYRENEHYPDSLDELRLQPLLPNLQIEYGRLEEGYRLRNMLFEVIRAGQR